MKIDPIRILPAVLAALFLVSAVSGWAGDLKTLGQRFSYALGMKVGQDISRLSGEIDTTIFLRGIQDRIKGNTLLLTAKEAQEAQTAFRKKVQQKMAREREQQGAGNLKAGEAFLKANRSKAGVRVTKSGLQYQVLTPGSGAKPKATDVVKVHYRGTLLDGTEFDSSQRRKKPATFPLNRVIPGWTEGLQLVPVGGKYRLFIPSRLAYGKRGSPPRIGPDATLIFDVELLEILKK